MKLQRQLLLVSLLLLSLPWAGCQYVKEIESAMRFGQEQSLLGTAKSVAAVAASQPELLYPYPERFTESLELSAEELARQIYFQGLPGGVVLDGYGEEWGEVEPLSLSRNNGQLHIKYKAAIYGENLYLFFHINDNEVIHHNHALSLLGNGDRLVLVAGNGRHYILTSSAPGEIAVHYQRSSRVIRKEPAVKAFWQDHSQGYSIEVKLPLQLTKGKLGFYLIDKSREGEQEYAGNIQASDHSPPWIVFAQENLRELLNIFYSKGLKFKVVDRFFWEIAADGELEVKPESETFWLIREMYRSILKNTGSELPEQQLPGQFVREESQAALDNQSASHWYRQKELANQSILSVAAPITVNQQVMAAVVVEQSSEQFLALTDRAFNRLLFYSLVALTLTGLGLLGYATWLSLRVRRLSLAAGNVLSEDGRIQDNFPTSKMKDEIGDLTRSYGQLLKTIQEYTEYLRTLSRKLSHELRTPLAIVHTSLDNLQNQTLDEDSTKYQGRAKEGASRLSHILTAMSEASRVEESIQSAEKESVDLVHLLQELTSAYQDIYSQHRLSFDSDDANEVNISVVPDLIVQMLDKLVDNAADFCPPKGAITISLFNSDSALTLRVINEGPLLPTSMQSQLFDNMVSLRSEQGQSDKAANQGAHLGLGLHIVRLIVEYHQGCVRAYNLNDESGVCFEVELPLAAQ